MTPAALLQWFDELAKSRPSPNEIFSEFTIGERGTAWRTSAASAIGQAFPPGHRVLVEWERALGDPATRASLRAMYLLQFERAAWNAVGGVFASAHEQLRSGRIEGLVDTIRATAEDEVLEQAEALLDSDHRSAASVLTGGALEVHLRRLCERNSLAWDGHGTIEKYNSAIAQARNTGVTIYEKADGSQVTSWGQLRNEAAHDPARFAATRTQAEVRLMLEGVRGFIARVR